MSHTIQREFTETGCYLDSHRGHYISRDIILFAEEFGFIVDPMAQYVVGRYEEDNHLPDYPMECVWDLADEARDWLNSDPNVREIKGQNCPPARPDGAHWDNFEGDFGLYAVDEDGEVVG